MRKLIGGFALAVVMLGAGACGNDSTAPKRDVSGTYTLQTVGGSALPVPLYQDQNELDELTDGNIVLTADANWTGTFNERATTSQGVTQLPPITGSGSYTVNGATLVLTDRTDGSQLNATIDGGTLTLNESDGSGGVVAFVFVK